LEVIMADVRIELDDRLVKSLTVTAELKGRTLEEELRDIICRAAPLAPEERAALSDRFRAMQAKPSDLLSEDLVREDRDAR
jgi:plasmid stability protein